MAVKIKLARTGSRSNASFRIVIAEARSKRDSGYIDVLGHYNPKSDPRIVVIDKEKYQKWTTNGAVPTQSVWRLIKKEVENVERTA